MIDLTTSWLHFVRRRYMSFSRSSLMIFQLHFMTHCVERLHCERTFTEPGPFRDTSCGFLNSITVLRYLGPRLGCLTECSFTKIKTTLCAVFVSLKILAVTIFPFSISPIAASVPTLVPHSSLFLHSPPLFLLLCLFSINFNDMPFHWLNKSDEGVSGGTNSGDYLRDRRYRPLFSVVRYIKQYGITTDGRHFSNICLVRNARETQDVNSGPFEASRYLRGRRGKVVERLGRTWNDWIDLQLSENSQSIGPFLRRGRLRVTAGKIVRQLVEFPSSYFAKALRGGIWISPSIWSDSFLLKLALLVLGRRFKFHVRFLSRGVLVGRLNVERFGVPHLVQHELFAVQTSW